MNRRDFVALATASAVTLGRTSAQALSGAAAPQLTFGLLTDVQFADAAPSGERYYRASLPKLKAAVASLAKLNLPFTLHLGDLVDRDFKSFACVLPLLDPLGHPVQHLLGNHDYAVTDAEKARIVSSMGIPHDYYLVRHAGIRLLMLDTTDLAAYKHPADSPLARAANDHLSQLAATKAANAQPWNGGLGATQLAWLARELAAADAAGERVIICGHHPLLPADAHQLWNAAAVLQLIDQHPCVIAYLNGHNHAGAEVVREGVPYITFKSILHQPDTTAFAVVQVFPDRLAIVGHGREASRSFPLRGVSPQEPQ